MVEKALIDRKRGELYSFLIRRARAAGICRRRLHYQPDGDSTTENGAAVKEFFAKKIGLYSVLTSGSARCAMIGNSFLRSAACR